MSTYQGTYTNVARLYLLSSLNLSDDLLIYPILVAGESYAGQYIPYIASGFLDEKDETYFNLKGIQINDPSINSDVTMMESMICHSTVDQITLTNYSPYLPCGVEVPERPVIERHNHQQPY